MWYSKMVLGVVGLVDSEESWTGLILKHWDSHDLFVGNVKGFLVLFYT